MHGVCCLLFVVCCVLVVVWCVVVVFADCCLLLVAGWSLVVVRCALFVVRSLFVRSFGWLFVARCFVLVVCCLLCC